MAMAIQDKLMEAVVQHRLHLVVAATLTAAVFSLLKVGPSFAAVAEFFWPLLLSTGFLLVAVAVILRISPPAGDGTSGEDLIDYVAGRLSEEDPHLADYDEEGEEDEHHAKSQ